MAAPTARKTAPRKAAPTKAATAAKREARRTGTAPPLKVTYRGAVFEIPVERLTSARVYQRAKALAQFSTNGLLADYVYELLGATDAARFINLLAPGDEFEPFGDFLTAMNKAANVPNS